MRVMRLWLVRRRPRWIRVWVLYCVVGRRLRWVSNSAPCLAEARGSSCWVDSDEGGMGQGLTQPPATRSQQDNRHRNRPTLSRRLASQRLEQSRSRLRAHLGDRYRQGRNDRTSARGTRCDSEVAGREAGRPGCREYQDHLWR